MTREEAIEIINGEVGAMSERENEALDMAVRSLEAWDKVIEEIDDIDVLLFDDRCEVKEECKYIIKKHMREVEDEM